MATYTPQAVNSTGVALVFNTSANGDKVPPGVTLIVRNTAGAPATVTLVTPLVLDGDLTVSDRTSGSIAATTGVNAIKIPNSEVFRDPADGLVTLNFSAPGAALAYAVIS
jgi:hypothetical protein